MKGKTTCKVCGMEFPLIAEEHYIAQDPGKIGVFARLADTNTSKQYDVFDCPYCGCQNIVQERKPLWMPEECDSTEIVEHEESEESKESKESNVDLTVDDMRKFLLDYCTYRHCIGCPLDKRGFLCGRGYTFRSTIPGEFGYLSDEQIKKHYNALKDEMKEDK